MFRKHYRYALSWAVLVLILCGIPGHDLPKLSFLQWLRPDKIVHLILFGVQSFLLIPAFQNNGNSEWLRKNNKAMAVACSIGYGILVEILQSTIFIGRTGDVRDAIANSIGAFLGLYIFNYYRKRQQEKN